MKKTLLLLYFIPALLAAADTAPLGNTGLTLTKPPAWTFHKTGGNLLLDIRRSYPGEKGQLAARILMRRVANPSRRLPEFATLTADSIRKQYFNTVSRTITAGPPFFHYRYLFVAEPAAQSGDRLLWVDLRIFPWKNDYLVFYAAARSRKELEEADRIFLTIRLGG